jgi:hypothetical protein
VVSWVYEERNDGFIAFEAKAGTNYRFTVLETDSYARIELLDKDGHTQIPVRIRAERIDYEEFNYHRSFTFSWTAASSGTYYVSLNWGRYSLSVEEASEGVNDEDAPETTPSPAQQDATESIGSAAGTIKDGKVDFISFHAIAGRSYRFCTVLGSLDDSILGLFDPMTQKLIAINDDTEDETLWDDDVQSLSSQLVWTADRTGDVYLIISGFDEETNGTYRLEIYSTTAALKEEKLESLSLPAAKTKVIAGAVADALYADDEDASSDDVWDDSQNNWDDSSLLDSDPWDEEEFSEDI